MENKIFDNLSGKLLIASPYALQGNVFHKSIIYMLSHTSNGSVGLILNHLIKSLSVASLLHTLSSEIDTDALKLPIHLGGPLELERVFFLHSADYDKNLLFKFADNLAISSNPEILKDMAAGIGPKNSLFMLGYTAWGAGQLEVELEDNLWIVSDYNQDLIFSDAENENKWISALQNLGIDNSLFSTTVGRS